MKKSVSVFVAVAAVVLLCGAPGGGGIAFGDTYLQGVGGDHARSFKHDRFYTGADRDFHAEAYDFSGVGKAGSQWVTMISPRFFVSAVHWGPSGTVTFYEGNSTTSGAHTYTILGGGSVGGDLLLGRLTEDIPAEDNITYYPVLDLPQESDYLGRLIYPYGNPHRVGLNNIDYIYDATLGGTTTRAMRFDFDMIEGEGAGESEAYMMGGDSGGPTFTICDGKLALLGTHWFNCGTPYNHAVSGDSFVPHYIDDMNTAMAPFGQSVTTVPEPALAMLLLVGLPWAVRRRAGRR